MVTSEATPVLTHQGSVKNFFQELQDNFHSIGSIQCCQPNVETFLYK
jgi:hypothetical protein